MSVLLEKSSYDEYVLRIDEDDIKRMIINHLLLDFELDEMNKDEGEEIDELFHDYVHHFRSQGWSLHDNLFRSSLNSWKKLTEVV